ncbi:MULTISPECIES: LacI family DNA-binding transcriptional regulator [unclassified Actinomyces]|uniref:LacI family DNA-binding transcriptional regulator n=1 Tax=unclassified Actinomyces TaxID=2609248 RepID=UPI002017DB04|nr:MULTISPECIES: LacI family DNA-binding transcriptional regulator [unclassified Actinomyces]MCL3778274.1 LacI family DNA-binding transcriptional regulator [Actinomyces sp. AC-20-1]MCL3788736.1 LacI family DNA-binding transcriptional regulator [Actinomyces sp. 187325]
MDDAGTRPRRKTVTIYDIAEAAGVAPSTVSRALSRPGRVSTETARRIHEAADRLGYKRTAPRRVEAGAEETYVIALVIADVGNPYFTQLMIGLQEHAAANGYTVLLLDSRENAAEEKAAIERVLHLIDGIVLSASRMTSATIQQLDRVVPVVSLNRQVPGVTSILPDSQQGMRLLVDHLAPLGHTSLTYVAGPTGSWANGARWEALGAACRAAGIRAHRIGPFPPTVMGGVRSVDAWAAGPTSVVVGYNDILAIGFMKAAMARGLDVPGDVSVVGIDNAGLSSLTDPGLTSLATGSRTLGSSASTAMVGFLRHRSQAQPLVTLLEMSLKHRQSVGPAPGHPPALLAPSPGS